MTNQWVLSIIAKPPDDLGASSTEESDGSNAIGEIFESLSKTAGEPGVPGELGDPVYQTEVARAAYVADIQTALYNFKQKHDIDPDIIQLIGHGSPGRLQLGAYWSRKSQDPILGFAVLDSNPDSYGTLFEYITSKSRVFLLGCNVGSSAPSGYVASGKALLFDLEDMTGANVYAADDLVHPGLFKNGLYKGSLVTSSGKPANPGVLPFAPEPITKEYHTQPMPALRGVRSAPALGVHPELAAQGSAMLDFFKNYVYSSPQPGKLLAMSELELAADGYVRVDAICGLRYVRFQDARGSTVYYEQRQTAGPDKARRGPDPAPALKHLRTEYRDQIATAATARRA